MVERALRDLFCMDTNLIHKGLVPSWPNNLAEAPLPNTATLSIWIPTFEWGGGRGDPKYSDYSNILANIQHYQLHPLCSISTPSPIQFSSVTESRPTLCDPMNRSTPGLPVHHQLPEFTQTHVHRISDAIQPSHPLSSLSPPVPSPSQHQGLFQWVNSLHEVAKV